MKIFNGRAATEEYMSTHSLTFSTPEMTLKKFALWLGESVSQPGGREPIPRLLTYIEEKGEKRDSDVIPDTDDSFKPSGAVTEMYEGITMPGASTDEMEPPQIKPLGNEDDASKFCIECGGKLRAEVKFCTKCGSRQE